MTQPSAPPQLSPDGHWWWNGAEWVAVQQPVPAPVHVPVQPVPYAMPPAPSGHDGLAITSLVTSILWLWGVGSIVAVITGHLSRSKAKREMRNPSGLALAGLIIGYVGLAGTLLITLAVAVPVFNNQRAKGYDAAAKSDLRSAATLEETFFTDNLTYTDLSGIEGIGFSPSTGVDLEVVSATNETYCLSASSRSGSTWYYDSTSSSGVTTVPCS